MRDVLGTIQADQDAIIRAGSRGALVVDGGPGTGKTVVALHRTAYLLYSDPRLGHRRGGVLFVGPHQPYLAYVADVLPSLGEEGVQTCTLRDLVPEGAARRHRDRPGGRAAQGHPRRLVDADRAGRAVSTRSRRPQGMEVETPWADVWLSAADWAEAFDAPDPGTPHNEARDEVWEALLDDPRRPSASTTRRCAPRPAAPRTACRTTSCRTLRPGLAAARPGRPRRRPVVGARPTCAGARPWLEPSRRSGCSSAPSRSAWTVSDLPLLDAARLRLGDPEASRRRDGATPRSPPSARRWPGSSTHLIAADDSEMQRHVDAARAGPAERPRRRGGAPTPDPDLLAGPFAHIVVDEAQELTDAEWQMLLPRCPSRSFTIVGDRAQARHGFTESWQERLERVGLDRVDLASLSINYRTPAEVMAEAEPVIRAALPDANVPTSIREQRRPGRCTGRSPNWARSSTPGSPPTPRGSPASSARARRSSRDSARPVADPGAGQGARVRPGRPRRPGDVRRRHRGAVDRYVAMTRATQQLVILTSR